MFNFNFFSGRILGPMELILIGENTPVTIFTLDLTVNNSSGGLISVLCQQPLAMAAANHLNDKDYVVIEGFIRRGKLPVGDGRNVIDVHLVALEILKGEVLRL
jgi:hypothetical protein